MERDKKYNIILGLMIFFFVLLVGICLAWGISAINSKSDSNEDSQDVMSDNVEDVTYTVTFETETGIEYTSKKVAEGKKVSKPIKPTKEGYVFVEWTLDGETFDFDTKIEGNITLVAKWKETDKEQYTVTFNSDGGNKVSEQIIEEGTKASKPSNPTKDGYTFVEWTLGGKTFDFNTKITKNITLVAGWKQVEKKKYTVTFNSNGGTAISSQTITEGSKASKPSNPTRSGYTFTGWTLDGKTFNFNTKITKNITLVAGWKQVEKKKYTVSFNSNGGTAVSSQTITEGSKVSKPTNPTRSGYTFEGWTLDGKTFNFNTTITKSITLTAKWQSLLDLTGRKCINAYIGETVNYNWLEGATTQGLSVYISGNKAYLRLSNLDLASRFEINIEQNVDYELENIDVSKVSQIYVSTIETSYDDYLPEVLFLMKDGTIRYLNVWGALVNFDFAVDGTLYNVSNIVKIADAYAGKNGSHYVTIVAIRPDGSFYDLYLTEELDHAVG